MIKLHDWHKTEGISAASLEENKLTEVSVGERAYRATEKKWRYLCLCS
jgi:hypothetical protein